MYKIRIDRPKALVEVELGGMMSTEEVGVYISDLRNQFVVHQVRRYGMVIDVTRCPIQSQDMIVAMGRHMATMPKAQALAVVVGGSLARMQVRRLFTQPYARIVASAEEGRAWVMHGAEPATA